MGNKIEVLIYDPIDYSLDISMSLNSHKILSNHKKLRISF